MTDLAYCFWGQFGWRRDQSLPEHEPAGRELDSRPIVIHEFRITIAGDGQAAEHLDKVLRGVAHRVTQQSTNAVRAGDWRPPPERFRVELPGECDKPVDRAGDVAP